ncbi:hypothetical protein N0V83_009354 [Neocucurbitaria cava]|uniref:Uncharacterized protein n=1 Tax=Neocucurbitaria cava TaxID=798079 RepID=A0A9W9CHG7_9PLEO|nr:hypothetical protein N0V83_009354 [Neocucurbitaria cava]
MRLGGSLSLVQHEGSHIPPYAILSHTWGSTGDEVTYRDMLNKTGQEKVGYHKLTFCAEQVGKDGLEHFWIDTCCIDKSSSAELSEAITSMFRWYKNSTQCYVYLSDVSVNKRKANCEEFDASWIQAFRNSRWFTRGWTLQELLAPQIVRFFSREPKQIGDKVSLEQHIHEVTRVPILALQGTPLHQFPIAERLSWTTNRQTTREEDIAYSLLGVFGISMLPNYGEGKEVAFKRLHREITDLAPSGVVRLGEEQKRMLMESLHFNQIDARHMTIKNAHPRTCKWLLSKSEYIDWLDTAKQLDHHGFLWIKGKPGTGKSTLMKYAVGNARSKIQDKEQVVIAFFFNARGEALEKSTTGTYRSLLLQLLERLPALQSAFDSLGVSTLGINAEYEWSINSLEALFGFVIQNLGRWSVLCFIDALDECEERQIRDMIAFFERVGDLATSSGIHFHVCFSSRHYPEITIKRGLSLVLEGQEGHTQDITDYLDSKLKVGKVSQKMKVDILRKASGVFMWVVLVVDILNREFDRGRTHTIRRRLQDIPDDLHALFHDILTRDSRSEGELILCIQWVLFARQPLNPVQLYHAVLSGVEPDAISPWDPEVDNDDAIRRFILDVSKGLTEITKSKSQRVQFIHESVRDFLLKEDDGLGKIWPHLQANFAGQSHERLKQCCMAYSNLDALDSFRLPKIIPDGLLLNTESQISWSLRVSAAGAFPLLKYATQNVLYHADLAEGAGIAQTDFIETFPLTRWIELDNLFEKYKVRRHTGAMSMLYLLAERNLPNLIRSSPSARACFVIEEQRYGTPFFAAIATESKNAIAAFIETGWQDKHTKMPSSDVRYYQNEHGRALLGRDSSYPRTGYLIPYLIGLRNEHVLSFALAVSEIDLNATTNGLTPLAMAIESGRREIVEVLLRTGQVDVNLGYGAGSTPLCLAASRGHAQITDLLLRTDKIDVNIVNIIGSTALHMGAENGHAEVVNLLLRTKKVEVDLENDAGNTPLSLGVLNGHAEVVRLLLHTGKVDVNVKTLYESTLLIEATRRGYKDIVEMLLGTGLVDMNAENDNGETVLMVAARYGEKEIIELLEAGLRL